MNSKIKILLVLAFSQIGLTAFGCSCAYLGKVTRNEVEQLRGAYIGTVVKIEIVKEKREETVFEIQQKKVTLLVSRSYKGGEKDTLVFTTNEGSAACGVAVNLNDQMFVSWGYDEEVIPRISLCSRSVNFTLQEQRVEEYKREPKRGYNPRKYIRKTKRDIRRIRRFA